MSVTPGFDYEMTAVNPSTAYAPYPSTEDSDNALLEHDVLAETRSGEQVTPGDPSEGTVAELRTRWHMSRHCHPWSNPSIRDDSGNVAYEVKIRGWVRLEGKVEDKKTGSVLYSCEPTGLFNWKNPYNYYIGDANAKTATPFASVVRIASIFACKLHMAVKFASGEPELELKGNWCSRHFSLTRGNVVVATIHRHWFCSFEYTIAAGENIPLVHLIVETIDFMLRKHRR